MATNPERQIDETLTDSLLMDTMSPGYQPDISALQVPSGTYQGPYLEILEQPKQRGFRFRYPCEGPSIGGLPGQYSERGKKSYPSIRLCNYQGPARIVVSLVTVDEPLMPHAHSLIGKNAFNGVVTVQIGPEQGMTASFPNLGIQHVTRKNVTRVLMDRYAKMQTVHTATLNALPIDAATGDQVPADGDNAAFNKNVAEAIAEKESRKVRQLVEEQKQNMNFSAVRLCFQAYLPDEYGCFTKALPPCVSDPVFDSKAPLASKLKICRMDRNSGCVTGNEEVYLLCDKVQKDDIEVVFYETEADTDKKSWEARGLFSPADVHRQVVIVFKTPAYWNVAIERPVKVHLVLKRKSDQETSDPVEFTFEPLMFDKKLIGAKRKRKIPHFSDNFQGGAVGGRYGGFNEGAARTSRLGQSTSSGQTHTAVQSQQSGVLPANIKDNSSTTVTSEGGVVDRKGFKLVVPPGAVDKPVLVNITLEDPSKYYRVLVRKDLQNDVMFGAPIINLRPNGQVFKIPVTLTTKFTINDFNREDVIILHGTEARDGKITWQDISHNSKIDEAKEEVTTQMQHFSTRLVLIRRTWICIKYIVSRLNWMAFNYTLAVLIKKNNRDEKYELALLFMSQDVYNEEFYRERPETSALVQLKNEGFSMLHIRSVTGQEENKIYSNESLQVSVRLGEDYKLADSEHQSMSLTIEPDVWWNSGLVKKLKLDATKGVKILSGEITVERENGHATVRRFNESDLCGYVRTLLDVKGATVFNVTPIARLVNMPEKSMIQIAKFWKSEDEQLDMIMEYWKKENNEVEDLATLGKDLEGLKQEDYKVTERGQMHIRNLRKLTSQASKCENDDCKTKYFSREIPALFEMVSSDCLIESEGSAECLKRVESMNKTYQQKCSSSTSESITEWFPNIVPDVIQNVKEIFVDEGVADVHNGLRGLSEETLSQFPPKIRDAEQNNRVRQLVCEMCNILVLLCHENSGKQSTAQIELWGESLALLNMLHFLKPFFKHCWQDRRLRMRLEHLSRLLKKIMYEDDDDFLVLDVCNVAWSLINFAKFVPSKLVRFQLNDSTNSPVTCNGEIVQYDKSHDKYYQWFNITKESEEELQLHATASVYADGLVLMESGLNKVTQFNCTIDTVNAKAGSIVSLQLVYVWGSEKVDIAEVYVGECAEHLPRDQTDRALPSSTPQVPTTNVRANVTVKAGSPSEDEIEDLSMMLGGHWEKLGRRLGFDRAKIYAFHKENERLSEKAYEMLMDWKQKEGSDGTYQVLYDALCHRLVGCKGIAEQICCV